MMYNILLETNIFDAIGYVSQEDYERLLKASEYKYEIKQSGDSCMCGNVGDCIVCTFNKDVVIEIINVTELSGVHRDINQKYINRLLKELPDEFNVIIKKYCRVPFELEDKLGEETFEKLFGSFRRCGTSHTNGPTVEEVGKLLDEDLLYLVDAFETVAYKDTNNLSYGVYFIYTYADDTWRMFIAHM